jgi:O-acetyl-ADP-ribose deacetylase (regulator of RNase III)
MSRIYISSTFEDLKDYRQHVCRQLRRAGHDVVAMEDYVAQDERPLTNCLNDISGCDLYIGIFAWRYGYVPKDNNPKYLSITELEYRHAVNEVKECLVFLLDDSVAWPPALQDSHTRDGRSGELVMQLREELSRNLQVGYFNNPDHLASLVSVAVAKWEKKVEIHKRDEASRQTINQLTPEEKIVIDRQLGHSRLLVINDDIRNAATDIVVSSDDNHFTARSGVSKLLLEKLGPNVRRELDHYGKAGFRQGQIAITTGGDWNRRAVIHPAVIDLDDGLYPTQETIRTLTRRSLACAVALGAGSIAFPVIGGGFAGTRIDPRECVNAIVSEMFTYLNTDDRDRERLRAIKLYIFNPEYNTGLPDALRESSGK